MQAELAVPALVRLPSEQPPEATRAAGRDDQRTARARSRCVTQAAAAALQCLRTGAYDDLVATQETS